MISAGFFDNNETACQWLVFWYHNLTWLDVNTHNTLFWAIRIIKTSKLPKLQILSTINFDTVTNEESVHLRDAKAAQTILEKESDIIFHQGGLGKMNTNYENETETRQELLALSFPRKNADW